MVIALHPQTLRRFAAHSELLHYLDDHGLSQLAKIGELQHVPAGDVILDEGETSYDLYLLAAGSLKITMQAAPGREVARLGEGAFFGEMAFIKREPRTATVQALVNCQVVRFMADDVEAILANYPAVQALLGRIGHARTQANSALLKKARAVAEAAAQLPGVEDFVVGPFGDKTPVQTVMHREDTPPPAVLPPSLRKRPKV